MSVEIVMPRAGLTMVEGTIMEWMVAEGAMVNKGQVIMGYENEKSTIDYEALDSGWIHILTPAGETVAVGVPIAVLAADQAEYEKLCNASGAESLAEEEKGCARECPACVHGTKATLEEFPAAAPAAAEKKDFGSRVVATGLAKRMAAEANLDLRLVTPTGGPTGRRIVAKDVENYLQAQRAAVPVSGHPLSDEVEEIPWVGVRKTIARNMLNSMQQSAQCTCTCEVNATRLLELRARLLEDQEILGCKITVNDLLCKMLGRVLTKHPLANGTFDGERLLSHKHVHLSVAVGTEDGLMVPVVKFADQLSLTEISKKVKDLAARAKEKMLTPDEQSGGTFTITNVGMFPIDLGTPVLNPPQVAICGFGRTVKKPVVMPDDSVAVQSMMNVFLTFDHRVIDGLEVGRILKDIQTYMEHPELILA